MKVKELIKHLTELNPEEQVMVAYWTKDLVQGWFDEEENEIVTDDIWNKAVDEFETYDLQDAGDMILNCVSEEIHKEKK